jgi:zinc transport system permease protein
MITTINQLSLDILKYTFFQKALWLSLLAAIPCAIIGTYIVIKRISMITGSISHAAFGGLGISYFLGANPLIGATLFSITSGGTIGVLQYKSKNRLDTILSFLWAFGMAIGLIFVYLTPGYSQDLFTYLFGNIFLIDNEEMLALIVMNFVILTIVALTYNTLKFVLFDEQFANVRNVPIIVVSSIFYILIALTVIVILSIVGLILLIAFLTLPAATALFYAKTIKRTMIYSAMIIAITNIIGLFLGHFLNLPPGPIIILILSLLYLTSLIIDSVKRQMNKANKQIVPHACELELESFGVFQDYIQPEEKGEKSK